MLTGNDIRNIENTIKKNARDIGWTGDIEVEVSDKLEMATGSRDRDAIGIVLPEKLGLDEGLEEGMAAFVHAYSHDINRKPPGMYAGPREEEVVTYIRGADLAKRLGVARKFYEMGKHYSSSDLAFAEAEARGSSIIGDEDVARARRLIEKRGFPGAISRIKELYSRNVRL